MSKYYRLLIPHVSMRGNYFPRGVYHEKALPPEILKSEKVILDREEENSLPPENVKLVEVHKEVEKKVEKVDEVEETVQTTKVVTRSPSMKKTNHNPKETPDEVLEVIKQPDLKETQETPIKAGRIEK